jgi:ABC-type lipoprotein release transport system permease subunit
LSGVAGGVQLWARSELRRRWPPLVLVGVLTGLAAGLAVAAIQGANRTETAYQRMHAQLRGADAVFFPSQAGVADVDVTKLGDIPQVEAWGGFAATSGEFDEVPGGGGALVMVGHDWFTNIERAKVLEGRLPNPARDDEAVINAPLRDEYGGRVGAVLTWRNLSPADNEALGGSDPPEGYDWTQATGPVTKLQIVGVVRQPMESVVSFASTPEIWVSPSWADAHLASSAVSFTNAFVRLRHGAADLPAFEAAIARIYGRGDLPVKDLSEDVKRVQRSLDVERTALFLFAAAVVAAALVIIGQALGRSIHSGADGAPALRALGLGRRGLMAGLVAPHIVTIVAAAITTVATAVALSSRFPIGLGRRLDPEQGIQVDGSTLTIGVAITLAAAVVLCGLVAWRTVQRLSARRPMPRAQLLRVATRVGASVPVAVGTSIALDRAPGRVGTNGRPALVAAIVGVLGVVGAVTLVGGIDDVLRQPERVGQTWDLEASPEGDPSAFDGLVESATASLAGNHDIDALAVTSRVASVVDGNGDIPLYSLRSLIGSLPFTVLQGRAPGGIDEVVLGPRTASAIGARIGDTITVGPSSHVVKVVGTALLVQTPHSSFDEGAWLTPEALDAATGTTSHTREFGGSLLVRVSDGSSVDAVEAELNGMGLYVDRPSVPPDVSNLGNVRNLPLFLAAFLIMLAVGASAHSLLTGARSRSHELAVLRALGLTPRQAAACVVWQAAVIGVVALAVGIPLGVVLGRRVWRALVDSLSFVYVGPLAGLVLVVIVPVALAVVGVMALWPARAAARLRTSEVLRTE